MYCRPACKAAGKWHGGWESADDWELIRVGYLRSRTVELLMLSACRSRIRRRTGGSLAADARAVTASVRGAALLRACLAAVAWRKLPALPPSMIGAPCTMCS